MSRPSSAVTRTPPPTMGTASRSLNVVSATDWMATTCQFAAAISEPRLQRCPSLPAVCHGWECGDVPGPAAVPPAHYNTEAPLSPAPRLTYPDVSTCGSTSGNARSS